MKKILFLSSLLFSLSFASAQTIESGSHSTKGYIKSDGTIENSSHSTVGYIKNDGTIENKSHSPCYRTISSCGFYFNSFSKVFYHYKNRIDES
ncbi:hypothetical protein V2E39_20900 [Chryseobacterium arthrosphaerae]|uniref:Uncharacterized protein n=1 Tax=Chryseobacterium arthrosphaerae TaxID=651561 RepID=A0ABU7R5G4_9FLAO|nr:hypothetical protein [Chryseobacterium arthrosphaerae]